MADSIVSRLKLVVASNIIVVSVLTHTKAL
jgi:hypothetical protein